MRLTHTGRAAARAGGLDAVRPGKPLGGWLSQGLWSMLADVARGLACRWADGAWELLTKREREPLVEAHSAP